MELYCESLTEYKRLKTREVSVGGLLLGNGHPIRVQTMTTTDTMDTTGTVEQTIRCIEAGAELVRITAPSKKEAENLLAIRNELHRRGYRVPLVADIHFTPNAAEIAARIVEKVRVNPGNYADKKRFELIEYSDADYRAEIDRIRDRFVPLVRICREYGTAMRIGTNHGSLSDRIMSRYGDTPVGMVESAMEFLRIARDEHYHNIVLSMKSSNPLVMVQAYRLLAKTMFDEFGECYPLHLGVTEAGEGEDGRVKSGAGIGTLLEDGLGDTIRVSLTEEPELEIPVCKNLVKRYEAASTRPSGKVPAIEKLPYDPFEFRRRESYIVENIGGSSVPVVITDLSRIPDLQPEQLVAADYHYDAGTDKWKIGDQAADFIFTGSQIPAFPLPGTLRVIAYPAAWEAGQAEHVHPIFEAAGYVNSKLKHPKLNFVMLDCFNDETEINDFTYLDELANDPTVVLCLSSTNRNALASVRRMYIELLNRGVRNPVINIVDSHWESQEEHLLHFSTEAGGLFLEGLGDGICLGMAPESYRRFAAGNPELFLNKTSFNVLQAARSRISRTEYISCPSCGRTLFDLQETTAKIRAVTNHLKGVKIAIMGCIVNGPGEMADADFGYVGSGPGKITLYRGKEIVKRNVNSEVAVEELVRLIRESNAWVEPGS
ncbi:MAG TPA: (E)-4-hydroxy-3-methylbut-2-enyl-diphosphate synthase [Chitinophagaceae bacterium]|nr:(E)-4-hydroxy-3-methylbut-2-enyl-diphosphate synthase [Chitinophagaceae bacterium]